VTAHVETQKKLVAVLTDEQRTQLDSLLSQFVHGIESN
jgi:Spy/CpxP family protein refolding chaperone